MFQIHISSSVEFLWTLVHSPDQRGRDLRTQREALSVSSRRLSPICRFFLIYYYRSMQTPVWTKRNGQLATRGSWVPEIGLQFSVPLAVEDRTTRTMNRHQRRWRQKWTALETALPFAGAARGGLTKNSENTNVKCFDAIKFVILRRDRIHLFCPSFSSLSDVA